jgi:hypothetical protein
MDLGDIIGDAVRYPFSDGKKNFDIWNSNND